MLLLRSVEYNNSLQTDDRELVEVEINLNQEVLIALDEDSDISESNEVENFLD